MVEFVITSGSCPSKTIHILRRQLRKSSKKPASWNVFSSSLFCTSHPFPVIITIR